MLNSEQPTYPSYFTGGGSSTAGVDLGTKTTGGTSSKYGLD